MTNEMIIAEAVVANGLMTKEQVQDYLESGNSLPIHTYGEWKRLGYQVKKGEKAVMQVALWKRTKKENEDGTIDTNMFLQTAYMFSFEQVEEAKKYETKTIEDIRAYNKMLAEQRKKATA